MSRSKSHRHHHVRRHIHKQVAFLSRTVIDIGRQCRTRAIESIETAKRFSLISSHSDYQPTFAAQFVRKRHRRPISSEQIFGFHVVCGECDGFVVRNGVVRNCAHQRVSWASTLNRSKERSRDAAGKSAASVRSDVRISVQAPTPSPTLEPDARRRSNGSAGLPLENAISVRKRRPTRPEMAEPVPVILRPGYDAKGHDPRIREHTEESKESSTLIFPESEDRTSVITDDGADLSLHAGNVTKRSRSRRQAMLQTDSGPDCKNSAVERLCDSENVMQDWRKWSETWERSVTRAKIEAEVNSSIRRTYCDSDALMRDWREWSVGWERSVKSR